MNISKDVIKGYKNFDVPYIHYKFEVNTDELVILLPGMGYTVKSPLFYYINQLVINKKIDILHINYEYYTEKYETFTFEEMKEAIQVDVQKVVDKVLSNHHYKKVTLIGKSLGTIGLSYLVKQEKFRQTQAVWLTPLLQDDYVFEGMNMYSGSSLCVIGDCDKWYIPERFDELSKKNNVSVILVEGADHGLDCKESVMKSIETLQKVINEIERFIE